MFLGSVSNFGGSLTIMAFIVSILVSGSLRTKALGAIRVDNERTEIVSDLAALISPDCAVASMSNGSQQDFPRLSRSVPFRERAEPCGLRLFPTRLNPEKPVPQTPRRHLPDTVAGASRCLHTVTLWPIYPVRPPVASIHNTGQLANVKSWFSQPTLNPAGRRGVRPGADRGGPGWESGRLFSTWCLIIRCRYYPAATLLAGLGRSILQVS